MRDAAAGFAARGVTDASKPISRDADAMRAPSSSQDVIFNLAGQSGAVRSMEDPLDGSRRELPRQPRAARGAARGEPEREARVRQLAARVRPRRAPIPSTEEQLPDPLCVHAVHKLAVEQYLRLYGQLYGLRFAVARLTNPYGPGQPSGRTAYGIVNRMIHLALAGEALPIYGDGAQRRDYIYIDDAVDALLRLGEAPEERRPALQRGQRHRHAARGHGASRSSAMAGGGRVDVRPVAGAGRADRDGRLRRRHRAHRARARLAAARRRSPRA